MIMQSCQANEATASQMASAVGHGGSTSRHLGPDFCSPRSFYSPYSDLRISATPRDENHKVHLDGDFNASYNHFCISAILGDDSLKVHLHGDSIDFFISATLGYAAPRCTYMGIPLTFA